MKPGYKQTDVGVIPEEWEAVPLKGKVGIAHGFAFASEHFASHGPYRLATPGHFYESGGFRDIGEKQKYYVGPVPSDYVLQPGDVIVAMTEQADGLLGSAALIPDEHGYLHNQRLGRVKVLSSEIQLDYLVYVFNSPDYRAKVRETAAGTKVKHTSPEKLLEISVRLPPLPEQRVIAEALSDVDGLLGSLDRLIAKKRDLKQAAMQRLLTGQTRLPGFHGEWEVKRLDELADLRSGGTPSTTEPRFWDGDVPWCTPTDITALNGHKYLSGTSRMITENGLKASSAEMIPAHSIVMTSRATIGECAINTVSVSTNQGFKNFVPFVTTDVDFLYYILTTQKQGFISLCGGSTFLEIGKTQLVAYQVRLPASKDEQTAIAGVLGEMDAELAGLEQRREKTRALKQAMMQELLTGRTRLV
jgi:type I restriction enzyme S subunit